MARIKGKCLHCERRTTKGKPVLSYHYFSSYKEHVLFCTNCGSKWIATTKKDVMRQINGSSGG